MIVKTFEVRDRGTCIPVLAVRMAPDAGSNPAERYLLRRAGYDPDSPPLIALSYLRTFGETITYNPTDWGTRTRTMRVAHDYISNHFDELDNGVVVDVEYILGESAAPKVSDAFWTPPA